MCLKYASMCGAENVQALDTISGIKNWDDTARDIKSGWKKNDLRSGLPAGHSIVNRNCGTGPGIAALVTLRRANMRRRRRRTREQNENSA